MGMKKDLRLPLNRGKPFKLYLYEAQPVTLVYSGCARLISWLVMQLIAAPNGEDVPKSWCSRTLYPF